MSAENEVKKCPITKDELRKAFSKDLQQLTAQSLTPERAYEKPVDNLYELFEKAWNRRSSISIDTAQSMADLLQEFLNGNDDMDTDNKTVDALSAFNKEKEGR